MKQKKSKVFLYFLILAFIVGFIFVVLTDVPVKQEVIEENISVKIVK